MSVILTRMSVAVALVATAALACHEMTFVRPRVWTFRALQAGDWNPIVDESNAHVYAVHRGNTLTARSIGQSPQQIDHGIPPGQLAWAATDTNFVGAVAVAPDSVVVCLKNAIQMRSKQNGDVLNSFSLPSGSGIPCHKGRPTLVNHPTSGLVAVVSTTRGHIFAIAVSTASLVWHVSLGGSHAFSGPVSVWNGNIVAASYSGRVFVRSIIDGSVVSSYQVPGVPRYIPNGPIFGVIAGTLVVGDTLFVATSTVSNNFHALNLPSLATPAPGRTSVTFPQGISYTTPTYRSGLGIVTSSSDGTVYVLSSDMAAPTPSLSVDGTFMMGLKMRTYGEMAVSPDGTVLYAQSSYGHLFAVTTNDGLLQDTYYAASLGTFGSTPAVTSFYAPTPSVGRVLMLGGLGDAAVDTQCPPLDTMLQFVATLGCPNDPTWTTDTPLCNRAGVICDGDSQWTEFQWDNAVCTGTNVDASLLPEGFLRLRLYGDSLQGTFAFELLPSTLTSISLEDNHFSGTVAVSQLPPSIDTLLIGSNSFTGEFPLGDLPRTVVHLGIESNNFYGPVDFPNMPPQMWVISAWANDFTGSVDVTSLPNTLDYVAYPGNQLTGTLDLTSLATGLSYFDFGGNDFSGPVDLSHLPEFSSNNNKFWIRLWGNPQMCGFQTDVSIECEPLMTPEKCVCGDVVDASGMNTTVMTCEACPLLT